MLAKRTSLPVLIVAVVLLPVFLAAAKKRDAAARTPDQGSSLSSEDGPSSKVTEGNSSAEEKSVHAPAGQRGDCHRRRHGPGQGRSERL